MARTRARAVRWVALLLSGAGLVAGAWFARGPAMRALARHHLSRAQEKLAASDDGGAERELVASLEANALEREARWLLGQLQLRRGALERAFMELQAYTDAFPDDAEGWASLAEVRERAGQPKEAEAALTQAVERAPARADLRIRRARQRMRIGRFHGAVLDSEAAGDATLASAARAELRAGDCARPAPAPSGLPEAAAWPGRLGGLMRDFLAATRARDWSAIGNVVRNARSEFAHTMLAPWLDGVSSIAFGDLEHAERSLREALAVAPRSHRPIVNLIALWSRQRGPVYTAEQLVRLSDDDPGFAYPLPIAASAFVEAALPSKGEAAIRRMLALSPASPEPHRAIARFLLQLDRPSDAIGAAAQGLARFAGDPELLRAQARAYAALGDRERALASWEALAAARPDDHDAAAQLARLLVSRGDAPGRERALALVRALACDAPADPDVLGAIGLTLLEAGRDAAGSRTWLEAARDRAPESSQLRYDLAVAYSRSRDPEAARRELREALQPGRPFDSEAEARRLLHELEPR